jgi:anti-sigma B factor antagonist/stage II sporulation protein AA (anti-sigma F factor antagonist)
MTGPPPPIFEIRESRRDGWLRLSLTGELDRSSSRLLEERLASLRVTRSPVRLDLSQLDFIDSTGIHLLIRTVGDARIKGWQLEIEPTVSPQVMRLLKLVHLDRIILETNGRKSS